METVKPYYRDELITLFHGDCLEITDWLEADVLVTDPPYGMSYLSGRRKQKAIVGDNSLTIRDKALELWGAKPALVFGTWKQSRPQNIRQLIVWDKRGGAGFSGDLKMPWADITEEIYVLGHGWVGRRVPAIYSIPTIPPVNRPDHPTPKPVILLGRLLEHCPDGVIADPFAGSGSTLIACRNAGRKAIGIEFDEQYCEIIATSLSQQIFNFGEL